ncbi:MAG: hypothetical protein M1839_007894 [Geoglossum umbratile]|nr:MAG: hypothetical protein M1839_007894 [Geoglossum umbratile]
MSSSNPDPQNHPQPKNLRFADVGINLTSPMYQGVYYEKKHHEEDLDGVVERAREMGCVKMMVTASDLEEAGRVVDVSGTCYGTVGVHPCSTPLVDLHPTGPTAYLSALAQLAQQTTLTGQTIAFGELGLDYDRFHFSPKETQQKYFTAQLQIATSLNPPLPLFLHSRSAAADFEALLTPHLPFLPRGGLVHSFTGTIPEMQRLVALGLHIGLNGCSLKTPASVDVVRALPLSHLQIETDGPWCEIRPSHAGTAFLGDAPALPRAVRKEKWVEGCMVKGRNEPCAIVQVAYAVAAIKGIGVEEVCEAAWRNSVGMFGLGVEENET